MIVQYTFAVFKCLMSEKHSRDFTATVTNSSIYDCKDIGLISSHNPVYALTLVYIQYPNKAWFYPLILPKVIFSAVVIDHILMRWSSFGISSVVKPEPRDKNKNKRVLAGCRMLWEVWCEVLLPTAAARQIQSLLSISCALYEGVLLLPSSSCPSEHFMTVPWL